MKNILLAGGTGLIGSALTEMLIKEGYHVHLLTRKPNSKLPYTIWDPENDTIDENTLPETYAIINLAGAGIADARWTDSRKMEIINSRIKASEVLERLIRQKRLQPKVYISASAIGYYGNRPNEELDEKSKPGSSGFLAESVLAWEGAVAKIPTELTRKIIVRIGIVLSMKGGALPKMAGGAVINAVPYFGDGKQVYSWIHIEDLCRIFLHALKDDKMNGVYNGVAPNAVTNEELCRQILKINHKMNVTFGVPEFMLRMAMGAMADVVMTGSNVKPRALLQQGFKFKFEKVDEALKDIFAYQH